MTKEQAEELVFDLVEAVRSDERADRYTKRYCRQQYEMLRDKVIDALTSQTSGQRA